VKIRHTASFVVFGLVSVVAVYYIASLGVRVGPPENRVNVSMQVADINGLVVDSNVLLRGVPVGKVTAIDPSADSAVVDFYIDKEFPIPVDTEVRLENLSALGESYIGLKPRTKDGPMLRDGQKVATEDIKAPASISALATSAVRLLNQMNPDQLGQLIDEADTALPDPNAVLPNLARASLLLRNTTTSMDGRGSQTLANFQTLLQNADWVGPTIAEISPSLHETGMSVGNLYQTAVGVFNAVGPPEALRTVGSLVSRIQHFLDTRSPDLKVIADAFTPYMQGIAASLMNVDTSQILTNMLDAIPEDGVVTLHLTVPNP
jgi:phospholipid/cholesterol/gamma-HCH transport system substrate-binding protein